MQPINTRAKPHPATVLTKAVMRASDLLGLKDAELALVIGASPATVSRYKRGMSEIDPDRKTGELALLLVRLFRSLDPLVGSDGEKRKAWMHTPNEALGGVPAALIRKADGLSRTLAYLDGSRAPA